jgi:hypothetical protein
MVEGATKDNMSFNKGKGLLTNEPFIWINETIKPEFKSSPSSSMDKTYSLIYNSYIHLFAIEILLVVQDFVMIVVSSLLVGKIQQKFNFSE